MRSFHSFIAAIAFWLGLLTLFSSIQSVQVVASPAPIPAPIPIPFPAPRPQESPDVPTEDPAVEVTESGCPADTVAVGYWSGGGPNTFDVILPPECPADGHNLAYAFRETSTNPKVVANVGLCGNYPGGAIVGCTEGNSKVARLYYPPTGEVWKFCTELPAEQAWCGTSAQNIAFVKYCCAK